MSSFSTTEGWSESESSYFVDSEAGLIISCVLSAIILVLTLILASYILVQLRVKRSQLSLYFKFWVSFAVVSGVLDVASILSFCVSEYVDPYDWFKHGEKWWLHLSFILRGLCSMFYYFQKIGLFFIFNGRLYYSFKGSVYALNKCVFQSLNTLTTAIALISLFIAYYGLIAGLSPILFGTAFQVFRVWWAVMGFLFLILFNRRIFHLFQQSQSVEMMKSSQSSIRSADITSTTGPGRRTPARSQTPATHSDAEAAEPSSATEQESVRSIDKNVLFNRRIFHLFQQSQSVEMMKSSQSSIRSADITSTTGPGRRTLARSQTPATRSDAEAAEPSSPSATATEQESVRSIDKNDSYLELMIRSAILVAIFCIQPIVNDAVWYVVTYRPVSTLIPWVMTALNMAIDTLGIILFHNFGDRW
eukprot:CAMPEP_0202728412 /NCGR_PEP_ID=MMETSP1385-20130828/185613_1 /ASSEMBLY_ACC=CAM_ASM_000861 /TAXON_ID=933848 /ORGANISM="Elphidium margaritaceum" /LENGTH=417 /DNA_ID=CAMNT_0049394659 /DNA_START=85 /DNA_END=1335 /DNA_ORIENTATION=-